MTVVFKRVYENVYISIFYEYNLIEFSKLFINSLSLKTLIHGKKKRLNY